MSEEERLTKLKSEVIDKDVLVYLNNMFSKLKIEIGSNNVKGSLFELMNSGKLRGWCWQSSDTLALFMPDYDMVLRGLLHFSEKKVIYHGFVEFKYRDKAYIFDPCFGLINSKELYFKTLEVELKGKTTAKAVKDYFFKRLNKSTVHNIYGDEEPNSPMFKNNTNYRDIVVMDNQVVEITAHYNMYK